MHILWEMLKTQGEVAPELSPYAPLIMSMKIAEDQIRTVIWKWGETIQKIQADHDVVISIAEDGLTTITAKTQDSGKSAIAIINELLWIPEVWYTGSWKVVKIIDWVWAIVEFRGKQSGMIHISKLSKDRVTNIEDIVKADDIVDFEIIQVDLAKGRVGLKRIEKEVK